MEWWIDFLTFPPMIAFEVMTLIVLILHIGDETIKWLRGKRATSS